MGVSSFFGRLDQVGIAGLPILIVAGIVMFYWIFSKQVDKILVLVFLSACFAGFQLSIVDAVATVVRWSGLIILFYLALFSTKSKTSSATNFLVIYVFVGWLSLVNAIDLTWQIQRTLLLSLTVLGISLSINSHISTISDITNLLTQIAFFTSLFSITQFVFSPFNLNIATRYSGFATGAPNFSIILGTILLFSFWGFQFSQKKFHLYVNGIGFIVGFIALLFSAQRTGLLAGTLGLIPVIFYGISRYNQKRIYLGVVLCLLLGYFIYQMTSNQRLDFLFARYNLNAGLSDRDIIWKIALSRITENHFLGLGFGAAELFIAGSFHNAYLEVIYNTGFIGLACYMLALVIIIKKIIRIQRQGYNREIKSILILCLGYIVTFITINIFESPGASASHINLILYLTVVTIVEKIDFLVSDNKNAPISRNQIASVVVHYQ